MIVSTNASRRAVVASAAAAFALGLRPAPAHADTAGVITADSKRALDTLYAKSDKARQLGAKARAVLIFPKIFKAGLVLGGQGGQGALFMSDGAAEPAAFFEIGAASFGLQAGMQTFSYALFFITDSALDYLRKSSGWAIGSGPSLVVVDKGFAKSLNTTTLNQDVYAIPFGQEGLMAGLGLEGSKITQIHPKP